MRGQMTSTDELCRLLDEREESYIRHSDGMVTWRYYTDPHSAIETLDGTMQVTGITPAQAIAATLGDAYATDARQCDVDLLAENAELRDERDRMYKANVEKNGEILRLLEKNAKLRELCAGLWSVMWACAEQRCPHRHKDCFVVNGNGDGPKGHGECWYKLRMRELGIEAGT